MLLFYFTSDFQCQPRGVHGIAGHCNRLGEGTDVVGVVTDLDGAGLAGHDGFLGPCRDGAAAAGLDVAQNQRLVALVGEDELAVAVTAFLEGAVIVFLFGEGDLGTVQGLLFGLDILCIDSCQSHADKQT